MMHFWSCQGHSITHPDSDDLSNLTSSGVQDGLEVLAALLRLLRNGSRDQLSARVGGDLASNPNLASSFDCLAIGASGY